MNSSIENYARQQIAEGLTSLPEGSQRVFKLMYGRKGGKRPVEESVEMSLADVVVEIPAEKLDWALTQIQNSHDKLAQGGQQVSEPREIQRYDSFVENRLSEPSSNGDLVFYADHIALVAEMHAEIDALRAQFGAKLEGSVVEGERRAYQYVINMFKAENASLREQLAHLQWRPITPELPMRGEYCLVCYDGNVVEQAIRIDGKFILARTDGQDDAIEVFPPHWMPTPNAPEAK